MFDFQKSFRFTASVIVQVPTEEGMQERSFTGAFQFVPKAELEAAVAAAPGDEDAAVVRATLIGWKSDLESAGKPIVYSEEAREDLIRTPFVRFAIAKAYWTEISGVRAKN